VVWERFGNVEYRKYSASAWSSVISADTSGAAHLVVLPETIPIATPSIPISWTRGNQESYSLGAAPVSFP
jgi:hypothetical protein